MAGLSNEVFNNSERGVSDDMNALQALIGRDLMDLFRFMSMTANGGVRNVVLGGLVASPSGSDVAISVGALMQDSATLAPVPGALDSTYRLGVLRTPATVVMPSPGATTYYLIEAQMIEATTNESRDIFTPPSTWTPTNVPKQRVRGIQFQLVTGGANAPTPSGGNWVPIAVVRRPGGGGPVASTDIFDVRPEVDLSERPQVPQIDEGQMRFTNGTNLFYSPGVRVRGLGGTRQFQLAANVDLNTAEFLATGLVLAANTWYYLYLAPWGTTGLNPRTDAYSSKGVLVLSSVAPGIQRRTNSNLIALPAPWNGSGSVDAGDAYCIGAVLRNAGNTGWTGAWTADGHTWTTDLINGGGTYFVVTGAPGNFNVSLAGRYPAGARDIFVNLNIEGGAGVQSSVFGDAGNVLLANGDNSVRQFQFTIPYVLLAADNFRYTCAANAPSLVYPQVSGWRW